MTGMLASVNSLEEAALVLAENVDIIDFKNPAVGALGALDTNVVKSSVELVNGQCQTSATIGDLPMHPDRVFNAVKAMAETGVNYVKIGFSPNGNVTQVIDKLSTISGKTKLIAVLFADMHPDYGLIDKLITAGFKGVMLDTQDKTKGSLTGMMTKAEIERFVRHVKSSHIICGLAGSLTIEDIPLLVQYQPDYLGFRGALCDQHERAGRLNVQSVRLVKQAIADFSC